MAANMSMELAVVQVFVSSGLDSPTSTTSSLNNNPTNSAPQLRI